MAESRFETGEMGSLTRRNLGAFRIDPATARGLGVRLVGDWKEFGILLRNLPRRLRRAAINGQIKFGERYHKAIIRNIATNGHLLKWPELSEKYKKFKKSHSGDPNEMYHFYGQYLRSISMQVKPNGTILIGIPKGVGKSKFGDYTVAQYAHVLEKGSYTRNIAARPLWGPTFKQIGGMTKLKEIVIAELRKA